MPRLTLIDNVGCEHFVYQWNLTKLQYIILKPRLYDLIERNIYLACIHVILV